jgi:hypothetical protein
MPTQQANQPVDYIARGFCTSADEFWSIRPIVPDMVTTTLSLPRILVNT